MLAPDLKKLDTARGERVRIDLGEHYIIDQRRNLVMDTNVDLEDYARELGVLAAWETVNDD